MSPIEYKENVINIVLLYHIYCTHCLDESDGHLKSWQHVSESILAPHCILIKPGAYQPGDQTTHIRVTTQDFIRY